MAIDLLYDDAGDIAVLNGDFATGIADEQHAEDIIVSHKGHYKQFPLTGIGIIEFFHGPLSLNGRDNLKRQIAMQLEADGMKRVQVEIDEEGKAKIRGNYP
jgi:hypothetical protein